MSLESAGVWAVGVWDTTVWGEDVWREGVSAVAGEYPELYRKQQLQKDYEQAYLAQYQAELEQDYNDATYEQLMRERRRKAIAMLLENI